MYKDHPEFIMERTKDKPLWRYIEFWKFLDLLETSELYFPTISHLGDQHEGRIPEKIYKMMLDYDEKIGRRNNFAQNYKGFIESNLRDKTLVSSWSANEYESFAMWKMYSKDKIGIAIKTDYMGLRNSFHKTERNIYVGEVYYYNEKSPQYKTDNTYYTFLVKHDYYQFESEVRCVTSLDKNKGHSHRINVDLTELIKEIYISPFASNIGLTSIIEFLKEKYRLDFKVNISGVNDNWL